MVGDATIGKFCAIAAEVTNHLELSVMSFNIEWGGAHVSFENVVRATGKRFGQVLELAVDCPAEPPAPALVEQIFSSAELVMTH